MTPTIKQIPVTIIGGGLVGLFLAKALSAANIRVAVIESKRPELDFEVDSLHSRVSAVNAVSQRMLENLGVWSKIRSHTYSPLLALKVWDSVGGGEIEFDSAERGVSALGAIVENREIVRVLWESLQNNAFVDFYCPATPTAMEESEGGVELTLDDNIKIQTNVVVGADGAQSWLRERMQVDLRERSYRQSAVVAVIETEKPHHHSAWQAFLSDGVLGLLPLANPHHCAIVWSVAIQQADDLVGLEADHFNIEINNAFGMRLGEITCLNKPRAIPLTMRHAKQYVKPRLALIGDAAHTLHPLAGQGVNLGFMDAACLAHCIIDAQAVSRDVGSMRVLRRYERWRKGDNTVMLMAMRGFKELFGTTSPSAVQIRSMGLKFTNQSVRIKNCFMQLAMGESTDLPSLAEL